MPYDELIPNGYAAGKVEQAILLMKLLFFGPIVLLFITYLFFGKALLNWGSLVIAALLTPTVYIGLVGIPSMREIKEKPEEVVEFMMTYFNVVPFFFVVPIASPGLYTSLENLPCPLGEIILLIVSALFSSLYYQFVRSLADNGMLFAILMLVPALVLSLLFPPFLAYLLVFIPPLLLEKGVKELEKSKKAHSKEEPSV